MTTLQLYDSVTKAADDMRKTARDLNAEANAIELKMEREAGLIYKDRGPGFACWTHDELNGWYQDRRWVLVELERKRSEHKTAVVQQGAGA